MNIKKIVDRYLKCKSNNMKLLEQDTKNAFINPFLKELGYDIEDIFIITSEYKTFKNDSVDYAIWKDGKPYIFIEAKKMDEKLNSHTSQLRKYFNMTVSAKFGMLSNGIDYEIYTDTKNTNVMDDEPIIRFSLSNPDMLLIDRFYEMFNLNNLNNIDNDVDKFLNELALDTIFDEHIKNVSSEFLKFINSVVDRDIKKSDVEYFLNKLNQEKIEEELFDEEVKKETVKEEASLSNTQIKSESDSTLIKANLKEDDSTVKPEQISFVGHSKDVIYNIKNKNMQSLVIDGLCYKLDKWSDAYYQLVQYVIDKYKLDVPKILEPSLYYTRYNQIPSYIIATDGYMQLDNRDYLNISLSIDEFVKNSKVLCDSIGLSFECREE